jgi:uncharacterized membrane protein
MRNSITLESRKTTISGRIGWGFMLLLAMFLFLLASRYLTLDPEVYFPEQREVYTANIVFLLTHIVGSMLAILIGPFQFLRRIRTGRFLNLHRWLGRIYLVSVLFGGLGGLYMAQLAYGGIISRLGFTSLAVLWLVSGFLAYVNIRKKRIEDHRRWMTINYALTFSGVTLRLWQIIFGGVGLDPLASYLLVAWWCWIPNLFVGLWINRRNDSLEN